MNKKIAYVKEGGFGVAIINPIPQARLVNETEDAFLLRIAKKDVPKGCMWRIIDISEIPEDKTFRDAWELKPKGIE